MSCHTSACCIYTPVAPLGLVFVMFCVYLYTYCLSEAWQIVCFIYLYTYRFSEALASRISIHLSLLPRLWQIVCFIYLYICRLAGACVCYVLRISIHLSLLRGFGKSYIYTPIASPRLWQIVCFIYLYTCRLAGGLCLLCFAYIYTPIASPRLWQIVYLYTYSLLRRLWQIVCFIYLYICRLAGACVCYVLRISIHLLPLRGFGKSYVSYIYTPIASPRLWQIAYQHQRCEKCIENRDQTKTKPPAGRQVYRNYVRELKPQRGDRCIIPQRLLNQIRISDYMAH